MGFWFLVHPFTNTWRRLGIAYYGLFAISYFGLFAWIMYLLREPLLNIHFATSYPLLGVAVVLLILSTWIAVLRHRVFKTSAVMGIPQIMHGKEQSTLITDGIYGYVRNPRYLEMGFSFAAMACFCNYLAVWVLLALYVPIIHIVVLMEERELRQRFGKPYEDYCRMVPRFLPHTGNAGNP